MSSPLLDLNLRIQNLLSAQGRQSPNILLFEADLEDRLRSSLLNVFQQIELGGREFLSLRNFLGVAYRSARNLVLPLSAAQQYWSGLADRLDSETSRTRQYLNDEQVTSLHLVSQWIKDLAQQDTSPLSLALYSELASHDSSLVLEERGLHKSYSLWLESQELEKCVDLHANFHEYSSKGDFSKPVVLVGAPRTLMPGQMRTLLFGGLSPKITFVTPNWWVGPDPTNFKTPIFPGIEESSSVTFSISGNQYSKNAVTPPAEMSFGIGDVFDEDELETFEHGGSVSCRLVDLSGGLVLPIEPDSEKISTLIRNDDGSFEVRFVNPFSELSGGDTIFELSEASESDFIWTAAAKSLGETYEEFEILRADWLAKLRQSKVDLGLWHLERALLEAGVTTAGYVSDWLSNPKFTRPSSLANFKALLTYLGLSEDQLLRTLEVTKALRSSLISLGHKAREAMVEAVTEDEWDDVQRGEVRRIRLEEFGEAEFKIVLVVGLRPDITTCAPSQLRTVVKGPSNG